MTNLNNYNKNVHSQNGEDGIIEEILNRLGSSLDKTCCEFGAWDGIYLSNVCNLVKNRKYKCLYIEADKKKFAELEQNFPEKDVINVNKLVSFEGKNTLDQILTENNFNLDFDLLSIDIDGNDYHILASLKKYCPKIIIIEFNPTMPNELEFIQEKNIRLNHGSSALSIFKLAKEKNYSLAAATEVNLIFVHNTFVQKVVDNKELKIEDVVIDERYKNFIFSGFDGKIFTSKKLKLPWHKMHVKELKILPNFFQKLPYNFNSLEKILFKLYKLLINKK